MNLRSEEYVDELASQLIQEVDYDIWKEIFLEGDFDDTERRTLRETIIYWLICHPQRWENGEIVVDDNF